MMMIPHESNFSSTQKWNKSLITNKRSHDYETFQPKIGECESEGSSSNWWA